SSLLFYLDVRRRALHSFPTRRSSDLGSLQLAIDSGVDFPALLVRCAAGESVPVHRDYRVGVRSRWFWGDVDQLYLRLKARGYSRSEEHTSELQSLRHLVCRLLLEKKK